PTSMPSCANGFGRSRTYEFMGQRTNVSINDWRKRNSDFSPLPADCHIRTSMKSCGKSLATRTCHGKAIGTQYHGPMLVHRYGFVNVTTRLKSITAASVSLPTRVHRVDINWSESRNIIMESR